MISMIGTAGKPTTEARRETYLQRMSIIVRTYEAQQSVAMGRLFLLPGEMQERIEDYGGHSPEVKHFVIEHCTRLMMLSCNPPAEAKVHSIYGTTINSDFTALNIKLVIEQFFLTTSTRPSVAVYELAKDVVESLEMSKAKKAVQLLGL